MEVELYTEIIKLVINIYPGRNIYVVVLNNKIGMTKTLPGLFIHHMFDLAHIYWCV